MNVVITQNITIDGVVEAVDDWFEPSGDDDGAQLALVREQMAAEEGLLLGRRTFCDFADFWPQQTDDATGITDHLNRVPKYVTTRTKKLPDWHNSEALDGDLITELERLRGADGGDLGVTGSISVCHQILEAGCVDEIRLFVYPVVIGRGRRLFQDGVSRRQLDLIDHQRFDTGVTFSSYAVGPTRT